MSDVQVQLDELKARLEGFAEALIKAATTIDTQQGPFGPIIAPGPSIVAATYRGVGETLKLALKGPVDG